MHIDDLQPQLSQFQFQVKLEKFRRRGEVGSAANTCANQCIHLVIMDNMSIIMSIIYKAGASNQMLTKFMMSHRQII